VKRGAERTDVAGTGSADKDGLIPDERARQALRRAAELQAEAAARLQETARGQLTAAMDAGPSTDGFRRQDVEAAAVEAGISPEYIRQALVEQDALGEHAEELAPWVEGMGRRMLGTTARTLEVSRVIDAEPARVLEAMQRVFPAHPYSLTLEDSIGGPPLQGGVLVFQVPQMTLSTASGYTTFSYTAKAVDVIQIQATLRTVPGGQGNRCELTLRSDLRTSTRRSVWAGAMLAGMGGVSGGMLTALVAVGTGGVGAVVAGTAVAGMAAFTAVSGKGYGALYRYYLRKMTGELERLLKVVDASARTGGAFRAPSAPALKPGSDDDAALFLSMM
jgi:hypothetical protein